MKLIIQLPCFNESEHVASAIADLPRCIDGVDTIEYLVIDDGSADGTSQAAREAGVHHIVRHQANRGLATAFQSGLQRALESGADVIVNTDADNQYHGGDIAALVQPILRHQADLVVGIRPIDEIEHFSWTKKQLQKLGSFVVRTISGTDVRDATSGFRALTRDAALTINLTTRYTHTLETLVQVGSYNLRIAQVPVRVNAPRRESRLFRSTSGYVTRSMLDIGRIYLNYRGHRFFAWVGSLLILPGVLLGLRYIYLDLQGRGGGNVQSLILAAILIIMGYQSWLMSFLMSAQKGNRILIERLLSRSRS